MKKLMFSIYNFIGKTYLSPILNLEQKKRPFPFINERSTEYAFTLKHLQNKGSGKLLDVGPGKSSWPHLLSNCGFDVTAIDKIDGYWNSFFNRHYKIINDDITNPKLTTKFQFATCLSVLEHILDHISAIKNIHDLLEEGGYLILSFPYNEENYHEDIYTHPDAGFGKGGNYITQVYSRNEINEWMQNTTFKIVEQEFYKVFTGDYWSFGERIVPVEKVENTDLHHLTCILLQKESIRK